ncbi:MAG: mechanosensitive ion channel [Deltaproteobacteria bacterium]|nr:mechanosensitive ion channel [Deltaproteobacteria bacterium]
MPPSLRLRAGVCSAQPDGLSVQLSRKRSGSPSRLSASVPGSVPSGAAGTVTQIGIRASTVHTFDGSDVIVPNADLISKPVINWTGSNPNRRFDVPVGVACGSPLETTAQALLAAARRIPGVLPGPAPEAFFQSFGESSLDWTLRVWARMDESPKVLSNLRRAISEELGKEKIEIPFPQRDLNVRSVAQEAREALDGKGRTSPP